MTRFSIKLMQELRAAVRRALERDGLINVPAVAWELKARFPAEGVSVSELEAEVMSVGMIMNAAMFFHRPEQLPAYPPRCEAEGATLH